MGLRPQLLWLLETRQGKIQHRNPLASPAPDSGKRIEALGDVRREGISAADLAAEDSDDDFPFSRNVRIVAANVAVAPDQIVESMVVGAPPGPVEIVTLTPRAKRNLRRVGKPRHPPGRSRQPPALLPPISPAYGSCPG